MIFRNFKLRLTCVAVSCLAIVSCVNIPNYISEGEQLPLVLAAATFKYGNYCGAGHPDIKYKSGSPESIQALKSFWPPVDDVDVMCYAHDMCYEEAGSNNQICDQALNATAIRLAKGFSKPSGCYNLAWMTSSALAAKFWGNEKNPVASRFIEVANFVWTLPLGIAGTLVNGVNYHRYGLPQEHGTCYLDDKKELHVYILISEFEAQYREYAKGFKFYTQSEPGMMSISLPIPKYDRGKSFKVFEVKKYLNYYGFSAGPANTVLDSRATEAIQRFMGQRSLASDPQYLKQVWETLTSKYVAREFSERRKDDSLDWAQMKARYNYVID